MELNYDIESRLAEGVAVVATGSTHQGDPKFSGNGVQCVAMSACATVYSAIYKRKHFCSADIDIILNSGDLLYVSIIGNLISRAPNHLLDPEELPCEFNVGNFLVKIQPMRHSWKANGLYAFSENDKFNKLRDLNNLINNYIFDNSHDDMLDSYLLTGQGYTVSFWRHNNKYYLFNSHGVDRLNNYTDLNDLKSRLFICNNMEFLACLLFAGRSFDGSQYSIHKLRLEKFSSLQHNPRRDITLNNSNPVQKNTLDVHPKKGRPIKTKRGKKTAFTGVNNKREEINNPIFSDRKLKMVPFVIIEQNLLVSKAISRITSHKEVVKRYSIKNPKVHLTSIGVNKKQEVVTNAIFSDRKLKMLSFVLIEQNPLVSKAISKIMSHREAVKRYAIKNPKVHYDAVKRYDSKNPDVHRNAVKRFDSKNPDVNRNAVKRYISEHPDVNCDAVKRYASENPSVNREAVQKYNTHSRNIESQLRQSHNLIGEKCKDELNAVKLYSLKTSLFADEVYVCVHCRARLFFEEKGRAKWCCGSGAYNIQKFAPLTEDFYNHPAFIQRPRAYNNLFAFSALGVSHGYQHPTTGISFLKIQGRIYHRVFDLSYTDTTNPIGLYIHDSSERERLASGQRLDVQVVRCITDFIHNVNPYIEHFKRLSQVPSDEAHLIFERTSRRTHGNVLGDVPLETEVAAIISTESERFIPNCIAIWKKGGQKPHTIDILHPLYETFQYPLLYPHGNPGWSPNILDNNNSKLTQNKYVRCLLLAEPRFSELGRLSEEWTIDMYNRVSEERLRFINSLQNRTSSSALRAGPLQEIENNLEMSRQINEDETIQGEGGIVPGRVYLPCSFTGGPRYMKLKYMDAIALVNRSGPPSYFLTMTCNPKWPEIQLSTPPHQKPHPLICARVFNLKLNQLMRDLRSGLWFGKCVYIMHVIEFQKRGLPHAHICFRVEGGGPVQNTDIDKFVRADIPDESEANGRLRKAVLEHMIHGPCGPSHRSDLPCWDQEKKRCAKFFPKRETATTYIDDRGFTHHKRNAQNTAAVKYRSKEVTVSDLWVVPYNAALLLKYNCHINLLVYSARAIVKYLFKYITKGPDRSRITIVNDADRNNEIEAYVTKRYLGSCEATWRILEFDITGREPTVKQLAVHLEGQQSIYFKAGNEAEAARRASSDLLIYFSRPQGEHFDNLTYLDFYEQYIVHTKRPTSKTAQIFDLPNNKFLTRRQRGELVTRLFWVAPNRGEQFYLRLLLASYPCRSYKDLYALGGSNCNTFQEAAKAIGIANDESEYELAMAEASTFLTGPRLRSFFVLLAVNGIRVVSIWETYKNHLSIDIKQRLPNNDDLESHRLALIQIDRLLRKHGTSAVEQGLPAVDDHTTELTRERTEHNADEFVTYVENWLSQLSDEQKIIFDYLNNLLTNDNFRNSNDRALFIDGPAGTGKTLLLNVITAHVRGNLNGIVLCSASSGIAAQNYVGGTTAHSLFKFPINLTDDLGYWNITNGSQRAELIYHANVIIYDEAPMAHKYLIHLLDRSLRDLMQCDQLFGGKIIIFAGDFRQIPPVVVNAKSNSDVVNCSVKSSPLWKNLKTFSLSTSQRCRDDPEYSDFLLKLGSNTLQILPSKTGDMHQNLVDISFISFVTELADLVDFVFPVIVIDEPDICAHRAILTTHNENVREINSFILDRLPGEHLHFYSIDEVATDNADEIFLGADTLNRLQPTGIPPYDLTLKVGCVCIIIRNLSFSDRLVNGTKVIIVHTSPRLITVRRPGEDENYFIPRILFKTQIEPNSPIEMTRRQFPLQVAYAMTIHKSQGQTISRVGVDLRSDVFSHGQLYVALGRVNQKDNIKVLIHKDKIINSKCLTNNVVFPQLL